jgi:hypothetical protein
MINGVARAFFEAKATRKVCIELPIEDRTQDDVNNDMVALLEMSLYGTRDAAMNWQEEVAKEMIKWGFTRGAYNPCVYHHREWGIKTLVHGEDFVSTGHWSEVKKFKMKLEKRFEIKTKVIGQGLDEAREASVLNRVIRVGEGGWQYEPDQRHADLIVEGMGMTDAKEVSTPGEDEKKWEEEEEKDKQLDTFEATKFRRVAARANYLAADRADIMYAVKEILQRDGRADDWWKKEAQKTGEIS